MSYNIRYDNPGDSLDNWQYRRAFIAGMLRYHAPDIIGIQEGLFQQVQELSTLLPEFSWSGRGRDDGEMAGEFSAVLIRSARLEVQAESTFWLSPTPSIPSKGWDAALNRIVSWVKLKDNLSQRTFFVFNTHFDHQGQQAREESARLLLRRIRDLALDAPVVVTGDFNSSDDELPYVILTERADGHRTQLSDALTLAQSGHHGPLKTYSGFDVHQGIIGDRIDFVFVGGGVSVVQHATLTDFMDNEHFPSDHLPVIAEILLP